MKKVLIVGGSGLIGDAAGRLLSVESELAIGAITRNSDSCDFTAESNKFIAEVQDLKKIKEICYEYKPDIIINTACVTDVEQCEKDKNFARNVNVNAVENLLKISKVLDAHFIQLSSDYIFDGTKGPYSELSLPNPLNYFGKTLLNAENLCRTGHPKTTILRTSFVLGTSKYKENDFISRMIKISDEKGEIKLSEKLFASCSYSVDIALAIHKIIQKGKYGIFNVSGSEILSHFEIGNLAISVFGLKDLTLSKIDKENIKSKLPEKAGLINLKAETDLNIKLSNFENALISIRFQKNESKFNYYKK